MDFDSTTLCRILGVCSGEQAGGPEEVVAIARQSQPSFCATLFSAWESEGETLNPAMRYELDLQRNRISRYRELSRELAESVPRLVSLKGLQVGDLYPAGLVRYMNDLDYAVPDDATLWQICRFVLTRGFEVDSATFTMISGRLHVMVSFRSSHEDRYTLRYGVEVATYVTLGNLAGVSPVIDLPTAWRVPAVKNLLMLLLERFEQPYRARDLVDGSLLLDAVGSRHFPVAAAEIERLGLWPEYAELLELLASADFSPQWTKPSRPVLARARARRAGTAVSPFRSPVRAATRELQRRMVYGHLSRAQRRIWGAVDARLSAGWALRAGLLCFGLPVDGGPEGLRSAVLGERARFAWVDTPIGRFLLAPGDEIDESVLDLLPDGAGSPA